MPARLHRQMFRAVYWQGRCGPAPPDRGRLLRLSVRQDRPVRPRLGTANERRGRATGLRTSGAASRRPVRTEACHGKAGRGARGRHRRRRGGIRRRRTRGGGASVPRARRTGPRPAWLDCRKARRARRFRNPVGRAIPDTVLRRPGGVGRRRRRIRQPGSPRGAGALFAVQRRGAGQLAVRPARLKGRAAGAAPRTSGHWPKRCTETQKMHCNNTS